MTARGHGTDEVFEGMLEEWIVEARLVAGVRIAEVAFGGGFVLGTGEIDLRDFFENEIG